MVLELVRRLEQQFGRTPFKPLEPFGCSLGKRGSPDVVGIQKAGRVISEHVGLTDLTFIVSVARQAADVAGHIELRYDSQDVFIELSEDIFVSEQSVLAVLCHEIAHKFLHVHGVRYGADQLDHEFLTDVTAVYLGAGKIMLNGCQWSSCTREMNGGRTTTTTNTLKAGYLDRERFAFAYRLVCEIRGISHGDARIGLQEDSKRALDAIEQKYPAWFANNSEKDGRLLNLESELTNDLLCRQNHLAVLDQLVRDASNAVAYLATLVRTQHGPLIAETRNLDQLGSSERSLRYLGLWEARRNVDAIPLLGSETQKYTVAFRRIAALLEEVQFLPKNSEIIDCPSDGTRLRVPVGKERILVRCSKCGYKFVVRTSRSYARAKGRYRFTRIWSGLIRGKPKCQ